MFADTVWLLLELILLFFGVAFLIALIQRRLGAERLRQWMGGPPLLAALKGIAIGFVTPFCTYSAIPMLVGFRQAGVPPAGYVAFITAAPVLDPVLFGALVLIVGLKAALVYATIAFLGALTLGLIAQPLGIERFLKPLPQADPSPTCGSEQAPWQGARTELTAASRSAVGLLRSVALLLVVGVAIGLIIEAAVSPDDVATVTGNNGSFAIPVAAALGTPLYFSTSLFVPIADSLSTAGVGIGAIVALTISGAGANVPEFIILNKLAQKRLIAIFFAYVFAVALTGGLVAEAVLA
ncbi:MAG: hypothetical protein HKN94_16585 [Acidimicrobiales bacterium]|nr:hypothetical protein [Acidimicrobiales bacterium]RZV42640.1 MAG: hypothetical protein EX269_14565 [Acidimicrobiales bacterium]